jgi:hypothetical protein
MAKHLQAEGSIPEDCNRLRTAGNIQHVPAAEQAVSIRCHGENGAVDFHRETLHLPDGRCLDEGVKLPACETGGERELSLKNLGGSPKTGLGQRFKMGRSQEHGAEGIGRRAQPAGCEQDL